MPEDKEDNVTYLSMKLMDPWIDEEASFSEHPSRKVIYGPFGHRYWYETLVDDMPPVVILVFATVQDMKKQERWREHPPEVLMQDLFTPKSDLEDLRTEMDYYDYANFKSGKIR